jgi:hypothetical protein
VQLKEIQLFILKDKSEKERVNLQAILKILPESVMLVSESEKVEEQQQNVFENHRDERNQQIDEEMKREYSSETDFK